MIALRLNEVFLDLPDNIQIPIDIYNSIFTDDEFGVVSMPFNLDFSPINSKALGFPEALGNRRTLNKVYEGLEVYLYGNLWKSGVLRLRQIKDRKYVVNFNADSSSYAAKVLNKKTTDLNYGGERIIRTTMPYLKMQLSGTGTSGNVTLYLYTNASNVVSITRSFTTDIETTLQDMADFANGASWASSRALANISHAEAQGDSIYFFTTAKQYIPMFLAPSSNAGTDRAWTQLDISNTEEILAHMLDTANGTSDDFDYVFAPIKNAGLYSGGDTQYPEYTNFFFNGAFAMPDRYLNAPATPFVYFTYLFKQIFAELGIKMKESFIDDPEIKRLVVFNNYVIDNFLYNEGGFSITNTYTDSISIKNHVPEMSIGEFVSMIKQRFRLGFFWDRAGTSVSVIALKVILNSSDYEDYTQYAEPDIDITTNEKVGFNLYYKNDDGDEVITRIIEVDSSKVKDPVQSFDDLPTTGNEAVDIRLVENENRYYQVSLVTDGSTTAWEWDEYTENLAPMKISEGNNNIEIPIATTATIYTGKNINDFNLSVTSSGGIGSSQGYGVGHNSNFNVRPGDRITATDIPDDTFVIYSVSDTDTRISKPATDLGSGDTITIHPLKWLVPEVNMMGSSPLLGKNPFSFRLLFYRGMQTGYHGSDPFTYPLLTPYKWDYDGNEIGNMSLALNTEDGVYNSYQKAWTDFHAKTKEVVQIMRLNYATLLNINMHKKKRINGNTFLISKISLVATIKGLSKSTVTMYKV